VQVAELLPDQNLESALGDKSAYKMRRLRADIEAQLTSLKNTSFTMGFSAGKGAVVGYATKQFA
jgi:hypothetical protein